MKKPHVPRVSPYDTGKVKIGLLYLARPAPRQLTASEELLQRALLLKQQIVLPSQQRPSFLSRVLGVWRT